MRVTPYFTPGLHGHSLHFGVTGICMRSFPVSRLVKCESSLGRHGKARCTVSDIHLAIYEQNSLRATAFDAKYWKEA